MMAKQTRYDISIRNSRGSVKNMTIAGYSALEAQVQAEQMYPGYLTIRCMEIVDNLYSVNMIHPATNSLNMNEKVVARDEEEAQKIASRRYPKFGIGSVTLIRKGA